MSNAIEFDHQLDAICDCDARGPIRGVCEHADDNTSCLDERNAKPAIEQPRQLDAQ
ncbi:MAG TPA: hypothetical protein VJ867_05515 [Gemmatimonadaceae bacterium]|nr:hypothetical protein [Gemmatimonadaceae bacterium]